MTIAGETKAVETKATAETLFNVPTKAFRTALSMLAGAFAARANLQILEAVHITIAEDGLVLRATNLTNLITVRCPANTFAPGTAAIPYKLLSEFVGVVADEALQISASTTKATIVAGKAKAKLDAYDPADFPALPTQGGLLFTLPAASFLDAVKRVAPAIAEDTTRPTLHCLYFQPGEGCVKLVATDGFRLHTMQVAADLPADWPSKLNEKTSLLPQQETVATFDRLFDAEGPAINVYLGGPAKSQLTFAQGERSVTANMAVGLYPDYNRIFPTKFDCRVRARVESWQYAVRVATAVAKRAKDDPALHVEIPDAFDDGEGEVCLYMRGAQLTAEAENTITAHVTARPDKMVLALSYKYLAEMLAALPKELELEICIVHPGAPITIRPVDQEKCPFAGIIMPMGPQQR